LELETHFYKLDLRMLGLGLFLHAELVGDMPGPDHALRHLRPVRFRTESEALRALDAAGIGQWTRFPADGVHATLSRGQLRTMGFRGNF
jgi:hypothetical protein